MLSPSTRHIDLGLKRSRYEAAGCPSYWVVDPAEPSLTVWELEDLSYVERHRVVGDQAARVTRPFEVAVTLVDLLT